MKMIYLSMEENGWGHEGFSFLPVEMKGESELERMGFAEPKSDRGRSNSFLIANKPLSYGYCR